MSTRVEEYRWRHVAAGLCQDCSCQARPGRAHCEGCFQKARIRTASYRKRKKEEKAGQDNVRAA